MFFYLEKGARVLEADEKMIRVPIYSIIPLILIQSSVWARPNVVFVMTDDQGYGEMSVHGNPILNTPYMDRLHGQSIRLSDYHAAPMCTPSRGQLLTGLDAARNGSINVSSGRTLLRAELPTMVTRPVYSENGIWEIISLSDPRTVDLTKPFGFPPLTSIPRRIGGTMTTLTIPSW